MKRRQVKAGHREGHEQRIARWHREGLDVANRDDWQHAADISAAMLAFVESCDEAQVICRSCGVDLEACRGILEVGRTLGISPQSEAIAHHLAHWREELCQ
jgi:hypothetical protein